MSAFAKPSANAPLQLLSQQFHGTLKRTAWRAFQSRAALLCGLALSLKIILVPMSVQIACLLRGSAPRRGLASGVAALIPQVIMLSLSACHSPACSTVTWLELYPKLAQPSSCLCLGLSALKVALKWYRVAQDSLGWIECYCFCLYSR